MLGASGTLDPPSRLWPVRAGNADLAGRAEVNHDPARHAFFPADLRRGPGRGGVLCLHPRAIVPLGAKKMSFAMQLALVELWLFAHWLLLLVALITFGVFMGTVIIHSVRFFQFIKKVSDRNSRGNQS